MTEKKMPVGSDDTNDRHQQTVQEAKKDVGAATRAEIANKALITLSELRDQQERGLSHYDDEGNLLNVDQALARALAGRLVHARMAPEEKEMRVTKGPILEEKS